MTIARVDNIHKDWSIRDKFKGKVIYCMVLLDETVTSVDVIENEAGTRWLKLEMIPSRAGEVAYTLGAEVEKQRSGV